MEPAGSLMDTPSSVLRRAGAGRSSFHPQRRFLDDQPVKKHRLLAFEIHFGDCPRN
jgi:hypothetical protein